MKKQLTLLIATFLFSFTSFFMAPSFSQTVKSVDIYGATPDINSSTPTISNAAKSSSSPFYYYPDFPSFEQVEADGACWLISNSNTVIITVSVAIPNDELFCGFFDYGWLTYQYSDIDNCSFTFDFQLIDAEGDSIDIDEDSGMRPVIPGETYDFTWTVSTAFPCGITKICPSPLLLRTEYKIKHIWTDETDEVILDSIQSTGISPSVFKVCADGDFASKFDLHLINQGVCANNFSIRLVEDPDGNDAEQYGSFDNADPRPNRLKVDYTHPKKLPSSNNVEKEIYALEICDEDNPMYKLEEIDFEVYRAPVLMVHGLWSNNGAFFEFKNELISSGLYNQDFLYKADYSRSNDVYFVENDSVLLKALERLTRRVKDRKVSVGKADVVGHSMGGLLTRLYLKSEIYNDDVARLITLNSPHSGSQMADLLLDDNYWLSSTLRYLLNKSGRDTGKGAIDDLRVNGPTINGVLNGTPNGEIVPSFTLTTTKPLPIILPTVLTKVPKIGWIGSVLLYIIDDVDEAFNGETNDWVVALSSQQGGLPMTKNISGVIHIGSPKNETVMDEVENLLKSPQNSSLFSTNGFSPVPLTYTTPFPFRLPENPSNSNSTLLISSPADEAVFAPNDIVNITVDGSDDITDIILSISYPNDSIYVMLANDSQLQTDFTVDQVSGARSIIALGRTTDGDILTHDITINTCPAQIALNNQEISTSEHFADESIITNGSIEDQSNVFFSVGDEVQLSPGFSTEVGTTFTIEMNGCGNN